MSVFESAFGADEEQVSLDSARESTGVTVHVLITPREAPPALGATGGEAPFGSILVGAALIGAGAILLLRRRAGRRSSPRGVAHPS